MRLLPLGFLLIAILHAADWPRFRGPNGAGVDSSISLPTEFGPSKNLLWKVAVPFGRSSPIVAGGRVFLTASEGETRITLAYDALTGRELWRRELKCEQSQKLFRANDPASPTPTSDDHGIYVFFPDFGLISYTFEGEERWRRSLGPFNSFYGMASSPVIAHGLLLLLCDQQSGSYLIGIDKETGRDRWKTERPGASLGWAVPIVYSPPKGPAEIIAVGSTRVDSYYLDTGEPRWWLPIGSDGSMGSPLISGDTVIVTASGHDEPWMPTFDSALAKYDKDGDGRISRDEFKDDKDWSEHFGWIDAGHDGFLDAREWNSARTFGLGDYGVMAIPLAGQGQRSSKALRWQFKRNLAYIPAPLIYDGVFYMIRTGGIITSLQPSSGAILKQGRTHKAPGEYYASPVAADGKIFVASEEGKLSVLKAAAQWEVLAVNDLAEEIYATPAISGGRIYVRTRGAIYCFGAPVVTPPVSAR